MSLDIDRFTETLRANAHSNSQGRCARYIRLALEAGGAVTSGHPMHAKDWAPVLLKNGIREITLEQPDNYVPRKGDIVIIQPLSHGSPSGHIQAYDGKNWMSDFVQRDFWPGPAYRKEKPAYAIFRP